MIPDLLEHMNWPFSPADTTLLSSIIVLLLITILMGTRMYLIERKLDTIHALVNSRMARVEGELQVAVQESKQLATILQASETARINLAQEAVLRAANAVVDSGRREVESERRAVQSAERLRQSESAG